MRGHIGPRATLGLIALVGLLLVGAPAVALLQPDTAADLDALEISETIIYGGTDVDLRRADAEAFELPAVMVAFTQYPYVVSYLDPAEAARQLAAPATRRQFGRPATLRTTDFSSVGVSADASGYLRTPAGRSPGWTPADTATYVVDSRARIASGPVAVGFSEAADARDFAEVHGGRTVGFDTLADARTPPDREAAFTAALTARTSWADALTAAAPESTQTVIVGEDAPTVAAAVAAAPTGATVSVPAGHHTVGTVVVERPLTIRGAGPATVISGDGAGSPIIVRAPEVTIRDLQIEGVGSVGARDPGEGAWDTSIQLAYGGGDAGIVVDGAPQTRIEGVRIDTPASGIIGRDATAMVVRDVTITGASSAAEGFMGVIVIGAPAVIEAVSVRGGRDGVYTHRADGTVIRGSTLAAHRYGTHLMYTSGAVVSDTTIRGGEAGVMIMTRPEGNLVVGNRITDARYGIVPAGGDSYIAHNTVSGAAFGIQVAGDRHLITRNRVEANAVGLRANEILPTNTVIRNDIVGNGKPAVATLGPQRIWTRAGVGNYWGQLPGLDRDADGRYDRPFRPTAAQDRRLLTAPAEVVITEAPAMRLRRAAETAIGGLREPGVVDTAPATEPFTPAGSV